ncbi:MAG: VTC domain-containing protein [Myxococcota bacterium]|nr:VTC domain-containing protein [Myxococcota bacterium]
MTSVLANDDPTALPLGAEDWVRDFERASEELLAARLLTRRIDYKYLISLGDLPGLLASLRGEHAVLSSGRAWAGYRTRYYDTDGLRSFHDHRRGVPRRFKLRHRDYLDRQVRFFEVKHNTNRGGTRKVRLERPFTDGFPRLGPECFELLRAELPGGVDPLCATVDNHFFRLSLLGIRAVERVTVDIGMRLWARGMEARLPALAIVEVKTAAPRHLSPTLNALTRAGMRPGGMSKYCAALALLSEQPAWFPKLRRRIAALSPLEVRPAR